MGKWTGKGTADTHVASAVLAESTLYGLGGNDTLTTLSTLASGTTFNQVYGGDGNDTVNGTAVADHATGYFGNDLLHGNGGKDVMYGGSGNDTMDVGAGNAYLSGDVGNDSLTGGLGNDTMAGGDGNDTINGAALVSTTVTNYIETDKGGNGNDSITAASFTTGTIAGATITNYIYGGAGNDTITGAAAFAGTTVKDKMIGGAGADSFVGGASNGGNETVSYEDSTWGVSINLATPLVAGTFATAGVSEANDITLHYGLSSSHQVLATAAGDRISGIENLTGSAYRDNLVGDLVANRLNGGLERDTLDGGGTSTNTAYGTAGASGNTGNDTILGGAGKDTIVMHNGSQAVSGTSTGDVIDGGQDLVGDNTIDFSKVFSPTTTGVTVNLSNTYAVGGFQVNFSGLAGSGTINNVDNVIGTDFNDTITAASGGKITAGLGADTILSATGSGTADTLVGGAGNDTYDLSGSQQRDAISVTATSGTVANGVDQIIGFDQATHDQIYVKLSDFGITGIATTNASAGAVVSSSLYTANYGVALNTAGTHNLTSITLNALDIVNGTAANAAHAQFIYNDATGDLSFDSDGNVVTNAAIVVGHFDLTQLTATVTGNAAPHAFESADFILIA